MDRFYLADSWVPVVREEIDEDPRNVEYIWPEAWSSMSKKSQRKEKQHWAEKKPKLDYARKLRGIHCIDLEDEEFNETLKNARKKWEFKIDFAMSCRLRKTSGNSSSKTFLSNHHHKKKAKLLPHLFARLTSLPECAIKRLRTKIMKISFIHFVHTNSNAAKRTGQAEESEVKNKQEKKATADFATLIVLYHLEKLRLGQEVPKIARTCCTT